MSRKFQGKNKDLVKLSVVTADKVWTKNRNNKAVLRKDLDIYRFITIIGLYVRIKRYLCIY